MPSPTPQTFDKTSMSLMRVAPQMIARTLTLDLLPRLDLLSLTEEEIKFDLGKVIVSLIIDL
jgi:hypothetical protein